MNYTDDAPSGGVFGLLIRETELERSDTRGGLNQDLVL